jgi:hypothetical protein
MDSQVAALYRLKSTLWMEGLYECTGSPTDGGTFLFMFKKVEGLKVRIFKNVNLGFIQLFFVICCCPTTNSLVLNLKSEHC